MTDIDLMKDVYLSDGVIRFQDCRYGTYQKRLDFIPNSKNHKLGFVAILNFSYCANPKIKKFVNPDQVCRWCKKMRHKK